MPQNSYANMGLQQDAQGQFSPIAGFGIGAMPGAEEISGMNWNDRMGLMMSQMGQAQQQGNQANLGLFASQLNEVGNLGKAGGQQITDVYSQERGRMGQNLASRGLGSTTVGSAMSAGIAGRESRDRTRLEEGLTQQRLNVLNAASFQQPDMGSFYNQMMNAGAAGLGQKKPKQQEWWKGPALGAGLDMLTGKGGAGGGMLGGLGKLLGFGGGGGGGGFDPALVGEASLSSGGTGMGGGYGSSQGIGGWSIPSANQPGWGQNAAGFLSRGQSGGGAGTFGGGGGMMTGLKGLMGGLGNFGTGAGQGIAGMFGFGSGTAGAGLGSMGAMGAALGPIAAIAGLGYLAYKNRKDIKRETKRIGRQIGKAGKKVKKWFKKIF
tara:strand:+ start:18377 stop:19510 length:1134 start_codon:yes stop_codon:yes gene_type:complete